MDVIEDLAQAPQRHETVLTIGTFDGVHCGHQALISQIVARARATNRLAALVTFHPHPAAVLSPERAPLYLTTPGEKLALLEHLGVDVVALLPFSRELAAISAHDFMQTAARHLRVRELWVGPDFALGRGREGTVPRLQELGRELRYEVHIVEQITGPGEGAPLVSSSRIRALLREGRVTEAAEMLGRFASLSGEVVMGAQRGRRLGFPTANLEVRPERAVPADGVYAVFSLLGTSRYQGVANVGVRPSFDNGQRTVETHLLDFDEDIYGCDLVVEFVARLRDERRFERISDLVAQIEADSQAARRILREEALKARECGHRLAEVVSVPNSRYVYQEIEHTADRALYVWGQQLPDLFTGAAHGMYHLMSDLDGLVASEWRDVHLAGWDRETLLVEWLNELLFYTESEGLVFTEYTVKSLTDTALEARVGGARAPAMRSAIKAATFHDLRLAQDAEGWSTVITFDV